MTCQMPVLDLPSAFTGSGGGAPPSARRRKRQNAVEASQSERWSPSNRAIAWRKWEATGDESPTRSGSTQKRKKRAPIARANAGQFAMEMYVGFELDGLPTYRNLSKSNPNLSLDLVDASQAPTFPSNPYGDAYVPPFDPAVNTSISIKARVLR